MPAPVGGREHGGEVAAGRMSGDEDAPRIATEARRVAPQPRQRRAHLANDLVDTDLRRQRVIRRGEGDARLGECRREETNIALVERLPVAAMDEYKERRTAPRPAAHRRQ